MADDETCTCDQPQTNPITPCPVHPHAWKRGKMHGREVSRDELPESLRELYDREHEAPSDEVGAPVPTPLVPELGIYGVEGSQPMGERRNDDTATARMERKEAITAMCNEEIVAAGQSPSAHVERVGDFANYYSTRPSFTLEQLRGSWRAMYPALGTPGAPNYLRGGDVGVDAEQFDKALDEAGLEDRDGRIVPKRHAVSILDYPGQPQKTRIVVDGVEQRDLIRYEIVHAVGDVAGVLALYRRSTAPMEIAGEFEIVEKIADEARRNVHRGAVNAFAITEEPEVKGDSLASIIRDAKRYRALRVEYERHDAIDIERPKDETLDDFADELRMHGLNSGEVPFPPGGEDAPVLREWFDENPARDTYGDASKATRPDEAQDSVDRGQVER
jgi:hypothetical protein